MKANLLKNDHPSTLPKTIALQPNLKERSHFTPPKDDRTPKNRSPFNPQKPIAFTPIHKTDRPQPNRQTIALIPQNRSPLKNRSPSTPPRRTIALHPPKPIAFPNPKPIALHPQKPIALHPQKPIALPNPNPKLIALHPTNK
jgi:hypothetical protein